jgi:hypothetical protein
MGRQINEAQEQPLSVYVAALQRLGRARATCYAASRRDALGWYHEKKSNDDRNIGLGPNHDWSSHCADAFGLMCIHYDQPDGAPPPRERYRDRRTSSGGGSWQSA